jgi:hypothetical protein
MPKPKYQAESQSHLANAQKMEDKMAELNPWLNSLQEAVADRDRHIIGLNEWVGGLNQAVAQRDVHLGKLQDRITGGECRLRSLQANLTTTQLYLEAVRSSISWKLTSPLREARRAVARISDLLRRQAMPSATATSATPSLAVRDNPAPRRTEFPYPPGATPVQRSTVGDALSEGERV